MNFTWLEDFLALAASGNFSRAADERHSSQPAFSRRIRALEEWLGADLVDRSTQPATLTDVGEWFRGVAEDLVARVARVPADARALAQANAVTLRIAATHALSFTFLPRWLRGFEPQTELGPVQLMSDVLQRCGELLQQGKVQFALSHAHASVPSGLSDGGFPSALIGHDALVPVARPDADGRPLHRLADDAAAGVPALLYSDESGIGRILRVVLGRRLAPQAVQTVFSAQLASVLRTMALDGRGVAWLPRTLVEDDLRSGALVAAADDGWCVPLEIRLYRGRELAGKAAEAFWKTATSRTVA